MSISAADLQTSLCGCCFTLSVISHRSSAVHQAVAVVAAAAAIAGYTEGDSDVISMPAGFRRHLVGKTLINVFHCNIAENEICFVGKLAIIQTFS